MTDVLFVQMPFAAVERPSLALGLFMAALRGARVPTESLYANIGFAERVGLPSYILMRLASPASLLGEWIFAEAAFREQCGKLQPLGSVRPHINADDEFLANVLQYRGFPDLEAWIQNMQSKASAFVGKLARQIVATGPKVVACTSMFDQHVASLALLRRLKEQDPGIVTVIGGANAAGEMGRATHHAFPWVDFTVTGEFDQYVVSFFKTLVEERGDAFNASALPPNVLGPMHRRESQRGALPPSAILTDMDSAPIPDFDDFFEQLYSSPISRYVLTSLQLETSRGCWWGAKQHCTFCGLNAEGMAFRKKSPARAVEEIRTLTSRYGVPRFAASDNIIDMSYFQTVLPVLAGDERKYNFFYESKANLKREHVEILAESGCNLIQPGIESLHDETLKIMRKGTTACINIYLLKNCLEFGVIPIWSILCGFPGSDPDWVAEIAVQLPALFHLPPPNGTTPIRYDRFSPYHQHPEGYGLQLEPLPAYRQVYPIDDETLKGLAYFFLDAHGMPKRVADKAVISNKMCDRWRDEFWSDNRAQLVILKDDGDRIEIRDTRPGASAAPHEVRGLPASVLRIVESPMTREGVLQRLRGARLEGTECEFDRALNELLERRLVWKASSQLISLPTPPPKRPMKGSADVALGKVNIARYFKEKLRFYTALA